MSIMIQMTAGESSLDREVTVYLLGEFTSWLQQRSPIQERKTLRQHYEHLYDFLCQNYDDLSVKIPFEARRVLSKNLRVAEQYLEEMPLLESRRRV
jgi:hypothetical protein